jgi:hypothetical protein
MNRTILSVLFSCLFCLVAIVSCKTRFDSKPLISGGGQGRHEQQFGKSAALLLIKDDPKQPNGMRFCSAVAVSPIHILTAARCLFKHERVKNSFLPGSRFSATRQELDPKAISVFFTERLDYTFKDSPNSSKAARREVKSVWINEDFRLSQKPIDTGLELTWGNWILFPEMNDIALLTLNKRIPEPLVPADLPEQGAAIEVADSTFVMTGYGAQGKLPAVSKIGDLQFFSFRSFEDPKVPFNIVYRPKKNLFAFDSYQSAIPCYGDSGGPLFRSNTEATPKQAVLSSWLYLVLRSQAADFVFQRG